MKFPVRGLVIAYIVYNIRGSLTAYSLPNRRSGYHSDESVCVLNRDTLVIISNLLGVRVETLHDALVTKRAKVSVSDEHNAVFSLT